MPKFMCVLVPKKKMGETCPKLTETFRKDNRGWVSREYGYVTEPTELVRESESLTNEKYVSIGNFCC